MAFRPGPAVAEEKRGPLRPEAVAFDAIGTLFDLAPVGARLRDVGLPREKLEEWYARLLRDAAALDITGVYRPFRQVAAGTLEAMLADAGKKADGERAEAFLSAFSELPAYPDAAPAFQRLTEAGVRVLVLTNGGADATAKLLKRAQLDAHVERVVSIDEVRRWKPAREVYRHAAGLAKVKPERLALVAAHDWDVHGAHRAGLVTGFVARKAGYHPAMDGPHVRGESLQHVADALVALPKS
ncbi:MAG: haloacid dehalogenase type II [Planctomycetes bacterium]|nr:haloacid dehalogenase type II [Planctomycetota bacterium]